MIFFMQLLLFMSLFSPVTLSGKLLLQGLWKARKPWDELMLGDMKVRRKLLEADLGLISSHQIPRHVVPVS